MLRLRNVPLCQHQIPSTFSKQYLPSHENGFKLYCIKISVFVFTYIYLQLKGSPRAPSFNSCDAQSIKGRHFHSKIINSNQTNTTKQTSKQNSQWAIYNVGNRFVFVSPQALIFIINCGSLGKCTVTY